MFIPFTFLLYISRKFLFHLMVATIAVSSLCFLASLAETARRLITRDYTSSALISKMAFLQTPGLIEDAFPFIFFISAISCFFSMTKRGELSAARTSGISAWLFLSPALVISALAGVLIFTLYNPASASLSAGYQDYKARYIKKKTSLLAISDTGLWLRQSEQQRQSVIHALKVGPQGVNLSDVTIFLYENQDRFTARLDARRAELKSGYWDLHNVWLTPNNAPPRFMETYQQATSLTPEQVYESVAAPDTISFWKLGPFVEVAKAAGFSVTAYELQWHRLISLPAFLAAMVLVGAAASFFFTTRQGREIRLITSAMLFGFLIYSLIFLGHRLGAGIEIPIMFSVWTPIGVAFFTGLILFLQREEG